MKVFITGSKSFIGKELVRQCDSQGVEYLGVDLVESSDKNYLQADIRATDIADIIPDGIDAIIHLAALSRDADCKDNAYRCFDVNVLGTLNLAEAAKKRNAKQFIFASSEWVYDSFVEDQEKDEESFIDIANIKSEYALSKLVSEANLRQKYQYGFCDTTILRFGIIYGPRAENWAAVESILYAVKNNDEVSVGSLKTARRFIHVSDIATGIIKAIGLDGFHIINLQGEKLISLQDIVDAGCRIFDKKVAIVEKYPAAASIRCVSNEKALKLLKWEPRIGLDEGLKTLLNSLEEAGSAKL